MRNWNRKLAAVGACISAFALSPLHAALTYPGCADLKPDDFTVVSLANYGKDKTLMEPLKMAFNMDAGGNVDVYFTQRLGLLRKYDGVKKSVINVGNFAFTAAQVPPPGDRNSKGLIGIALDPGFKTNHWIYLYIGLDNDWHISRFLLNDDKLDMASERQLFKFDGGGKATTHVAGDLKFDGDGNLWITNAENEARDPAANTNSYLGKILRIKPRPFPDNGPALPPGLGSTYDVPAGNLYPAGTAKTLPEIYIMGNRNPYTLALDPVRKGIAWGEIGPDGLGVTEEFNFATQPGNYGYPFWSGKQKVVVAGSGTPAAPIDDLPGNTGLRELKPAITATLAYGEACAVTGPIYYYNAALPSPYKFPPHLNGAWLISDFNLSWIDALELDKTGANILSRMPLLAANAGGELNKPLDVQMGPDGMLYVINYSGFRTWNTHTGLLRIEYHGNCHPVSNLPHSLAAKPEIRMQGDRVMMPGVGDGFTVKIMDASGREEASFAGKGSESSFSVREFPTGLHLVQAHSKSVFLEMKFVR